MSRGRGWRTVVTLLLAAGLVATLVQLGRPARPGPGGGREITAAFPAAIGDAVRALRSAQAPEGYWPTPVTVGPRFEHPTNEVNVFTPAVLVDLLGPVAGELGLDSTLRDARAYLRRQIEPTGLVRYHGDPGPVPAAQRGCELPADVDDTSLVWRIAPRPDPDLLAAARREIHRYRRDGLYLTWMDDGYQCFHARYAGTDPNPPDVLVQMHVYLFLAALDSRAAADLCRALQSRVGDPRLWVWYAVAPVLPVAREADMARAGCPVRVPEERLRQGPPGQGRYLALARLLSDLRAGPTPPWQAVVDALRREVDVGLRAFATTPPLLYHNDLSATPPHYHWSPEVGHALWLRLYVEASRRWPGVLPSARLAGRP